MKNDYRENIYQNALVFFKLNNNYTREELESVYKPLARKWHPDVNKDEKALEMSQMINEFYDVLKRSLLNQKTEEKIKEEQERHKKYLELRNNFLRDIKNLQEKYKNNQDIIKVCNLFLKRLEIIKTLDELELQRQEFNQKIGQIKAKLMFLSEREKFLKRLVHDSLYSDLELLAKLASYYQEKVAGVYTMDVLKNLIDAYEQEIETIKENERKRLFQEEKKEMFAFLSRIKLKYTDQEILDLIPSYTELLKQANNQEELVNLKKEFENKVKEIKQKINLILNQKEKLRRKIGDYKKQFKNDEYANIFNTLEDEIEKKNTYLELVSLEEIINLRIEAIKKVEAKNLKFLNDLKLSAIKACNYKFQQACLDKSLDDILKFIDIYKNILSLFTMATNETIKQISELVTNINYTDIAIDSSKIEIFMLTTSGKITNEDEVNSYLERLIKEKNQKYTMYENNMSSERIEIVNKIIDKWYVKATASDLEEIKESVELLEKVLKFINTLEEKDLYDNLDNLNQINFSNLKSINQILKKMSLANKIYVNRLTGEMCTLAKLSNDEVLVTPIDNNKGVQIINSKKMESDFMTINDFFDNAIFVDGKRVLERTDRYSTRGVLYTPEESYLYHNQELMLKYCEPVFKNFEPHFEFIPSSGRFGWRLLDDESISSNSYLRFKEKEICKNMVMEQVKTQLDVNKNLDEEMRKN